MQCKEFKSSIANFVAGSLTDNKRQECEHHLGDCENCFALLSSHFETESLLSVEQNDRLTSQLLRGLNLDPCQQSESLLCDYVSGSLEAAEQSLLQSHLEDCRSCTNLAATLETLESELARLAEPQLTRDLSAQILAQTSAISETERPKGRIAGIDFRALFVNLMRRPRFPIEAAFAATVVWTTFFGVPTGVQFNAQADSLPLVNPEVVQERINNLQANLNTGVNGFPQLLDEQIQNLASASRSLVNNGSEVSRRSGAELRVTVTNWINASKSIFSVN